MEVEMILHVLQFVCLLIIGGLALYFKSKSVVIDAAKDAIVQAEAAYIDTTKSGGQKFEFAVDFIYERLPGALKRFVTRSLVESIVQNVFDQMEAYAKLQLDRLVDKATD